MQKSSNGRKGAKHKSFTRDDTLKDIYISLNSLYLYVIRHMAGLFVGRRQYFNFSRIF